MGGPPCAVAVVCNVGFDAVAAAAAEFASDGGDVAEMRTAPKSQRRLLTAVAASSAGPLAAPNTTMAAAPKPTTKTAAAQFLSPSLWVMEDHS